MIDGEINYYDSSFGDVIILTDGDKKVVYVNGDRDFNVNLLGTDTGEMTYSIENYNLITKETTEAKTFENVALEDGKKMYSPVSNAPTTDDIELFVIKDEDAPEPIITHTIDTDGTEHEVACGHTDNNADGWCDACGAELFIHEQPTEPAQPVPQPGEPNTDPGVAPAPAANVCKYCGADHGTALWGRIVAFFHSILYFFAHLFGQK